MFYYPFHINDFKSATTHLTDEEELAYRRMLDLYYETEMPLPLDTHRVARRVRSKVEVVEVILDDFFTKTEDGYTSKRCNEVINSYQRQVKGGREGAEKRWKNKAVIPTPCPTHTPPMGEALGEVIATKNQEPRINTLSSDDMNAFELFWTAYDKKVGKDKCLKWWKKHRPDGELLRDMVKAAQVYAAATPDKQYRKNPETWLNGKCWEDELPTNGFSHAMLGDFLSPDGTPSYMRNTTPEGVPE